MDKLVSDYVTDALRLIGQLHAPGSQPAPEALNEGSNFLNQLLDSYNTMRNQLYTILDLTFTLTSSQYIYTIGPGGDLNGPRPQAIQRANLIYATTPTIERLPIAIIDVDQWAAIRLPDLQSAIPLKLYYDNSYSQTAPTGLGTIYLWPAPQSGYQLELFIWSTLPTTLIPTNTLFAPPGYARMITYNLAVELMPLYPKRLNPEQEARVLRIAKESRDWVESLNSPSPETPIDPALAVPQRASGFNWLVSVN